VNEHIENELGDTTEPVSSEQLGAVLKKLGSPLQWVPEEEIPWWRKFIIRIHSGPEDWRLAYLSFGLLLLGFIFLPSFFVFLVASYLVSRAAISFSNYNLQVEEQKWLLYPSLIIVNVMIFSALLLWPLTITIDVGYGFASKINRSHSQFYGEIRYLIMAVSFVISSLGLWWLIFASFLMKKTKLIQTLVRPFNDILKKKYLWVFWLISLGMFLIFAVIGLLPWLLFV
jgi:hypothetical protein